MPTFEYYSTFDESIDILRDLCDQGFKVVAEPGYFDTPNAPEYSSVTDELVALLARAPSYYLAGEFTRNPIQYFYFESGPAAGKYGIDIRGEGPLMQSMLGRMNVVDGANLLLPGDISYQPEYRTPENEIAKPSAEVKAAYRKAVATIKKRCIRHKVGKGIYIGPQALDLLSSGEASIRT